MSLLKLDPSDNVAIAQSRLNVGDEHDGVVARSAVPVGHKIATTDIAAGEVVRKYSQIIGEASEDIAAGDHIHTHNLNFVRVEGDYSFSTNVRPAAKATQQDTFQGYRRASGEELS